MGLGEFFNLGSGQVPLYIAVFGLSSFIEPLTLGRLFDTVGRKTMISLCYLTSAALTAMLGVILLSTQPSTLAFMAFVLAIFYFASSGAGAVGPLPFGVNAEGKTLESIAEPLSAAKRRRQGGAEVGSGQEPPAAMV